MKYLVATHGEFSKGIIDSLKLIAGEDLQVDVFSMTKDKSASDAEKETKAYLEENQGQELIVLTDIFGGSVSNLFTNYLLEGFTFQLITGVNLPLLLTLVLAGETGGVEVENLVETAIEEGKKGVLYVNQVIQAQGGEIDDTIIIED